jgi:hypothetical protein
MTLLKGFFAMGGYPYFVRRFSKIAYVSKTKVEAEGTARLAAGDLYYSMRDPIPKGIICNISMLWYILTP